MRIETISTAIQIKARPVTTNKNLFVGATHSLGCEAEELGESVRLLSEAVLRLRKENEI